MGKKNKVNLTVIGAHVDTTRKPADVVADVAIGPVTLRDVRIGTCDGDCDHGDANEHLAVMWAARADPDDKTKKRMLAAMEAEYERLAPTFPVEPDPIIDALTKAAAIIEAVSPRDGNAMNIRTPLLQMEQEALFAEALFA